MDWNDARCASQKMKKAWNTISGVFNCKRGGQYPGRGRKTLNRGVMEFFGTWGTHLMTEAVFGARCKQSFVIPDNLALGAYRTFYDHVRGKQSDYIQWTGNSENREPRIASWQAPDGSEVPYEIRDIGCLGNVPFSNDDICPYIPGGALNPIILSAKYTPI